MKRAPSDLFGAVLSMSPSSGRTRAGRRSDDDPRQRPVIGLGEQQRIFRLPIVGRTIVGEQDHELGQRCTLEAGFDGGRAAPTTSAQRACTLMAP